MIKDVKIKKWAVDKKLNNVSTSNLASGPYIGQKINDESDMFTRSGKGEKFSRPEGEPSEGDDLLIFADCGIVHPKPKQARVAVPVDYLAWNKGSYFSFTINAQGFANFRDEALTEAQAKDMMNAVIE